jgi:hypothetical protein
MANKPNCQRESGYYKFEWNDMGIKSMKAGSTDYCVSASEIMSILTDLVCINDGSKQAFSFSSQCRTQALWSTNQKTDYKVCIFFYTFTYKYKSFLI